MGTYVGLKILEEHLDPISYEFKQKYPITSRAEAIVPFKHTTSHYSRIPAVPTFVLPKTISCTLPGDLYYFYSRLPVLPKDILDYKTSNFPLYASVMTVENRNCILNVSCYDTDDTDDNDDDDNNDDDDDDDDNNNNGDDDDNDDDDDDDDDDDNYDNGDDDNRMI